MGGGGALEKLCNESDEMPNGGCAGDIMGDLIQFFIITNFNKINLKLNS
jgi:hypothetical protein